MPDDQIIGYGYRIKRGPIRGRFDDARLALARHVRSERVRAVLTWRALPAVILFTEQKSRHGFDLGEDPGA